MPYKLHDQVFSARLDVSPEKKPLAKAHALFYRKPRPFFVIFFLYIFFLIFHFFHFFHFVIFSLFFLTFSFFFIFSLFLRFRKAVYGLVNAPKKWWDRLKISLIKHGFTSCALDPCASVLQKSGKIHGVLGVHVDDVIGGGNETFDRIMTAARKEFDFGAWDVGNFRFKGRQISQMPNGEIVFDVEQYKSKADKTKPERLLNSEEHTQFRGGVGSLGWFVDHCCPQISFQLAELRRKQASPTVQDLLKLNKVIRAAKVIESKLKIRSTPVEHLRFMGVHDEGSCKS